MNIVPSCVIVYTGGLTGSARIERPLDSPNVELPMQCRRPGRTLGLALVLLGLFFFIGNLIGHWNILTSVTTGIGLLALSLQSARRRFAAPGAIALAIAAFLSLQESDLLGARADTWLFLLLAISFFGVYILRCRWTHLFPLSLAALLLVAAANTVFDLSGALGGQEMLVKLSQWWPALIILLGGIVLLGARLRLPTTALLGPASLFVVGVTAVLSFGAVVPGMPWAMFMFPHETALHREVAQDSVDASQVTLISVVNEAGSIRLYPSESQEVQVRAVKQVLAPDETQARRSLDNSALRVGRLDDRIEIRAVDADTPWIFSFGSSPLTDLEVSIPAGHAVRVTSGSGRIKIDGITGDVNVVTRNGKVELTNIGGNVYANLIAGDLQAQNIGGEVSITTISGSVEIVQAASLREVVTTSGRVIVDGVLRGTGSIRTISGDVRLFVSPESAFRLDYATTSGGIRDELSLAAEVRDGHRFVGTYNQGDNVLTVRTVSGGLRLMRSGP